MIGKQINQTSMTLRDAREKAGFTTENAAKALKIKENTLKSYEEGRSFPGVSVLKRIEALYGVGYNQLIFLPCDFGLVEVRRIPKGKGGAIG